MSGETSGTPVLKTLPILRWDGWADRPVFFYPSVELLPERLRKFLDLVWTDQIKVGDEVILNLVHDNEGFIVKVTRLDVRDDGRVYVWTDINERPWVRVDFPAASDQGGAA